MLLLSSASLIRHSSEVDTVVIPHSGHSDLIALWSRLCERLHRHYRLARSLELALGIPLLQFGRIY